MTDTGPIPPEGVTPSVPPADPAAAQPAPPVGSAPVGSGPVGSGPVLNYNTTAGMPYTGPEPSKDDRTMAMLAHLLGIVTWFVGALVIWLVKKDTSPFVDDQGKEALNFQITVTIGWIIAGATTFICIGPVIALAVLVVNLIFCIMAGIQANSGVAYRYPFNIRLIK